MPVTTDTLLLAAACPIANQARTRILDVGCGSGGILQAISSRLSEIELHIELHGVEISHDDLAKAKSSLPAGHFYTADFLTWKRTDLHNSFDHVVTNPPFFSRPGGRTSPNGHREAVRGLSDDALSIWLRNCLKFVKPRGWLSLICPSNRLSVFMSSLNGQGSHIIMLPVQTRDKSSPTRMIILVRKPSKAVAQPDLDFLHPLCFHGQGRVEIEELLQKNEISLWSYLRSKGFTLPQALTLA